jgi:hypothetical protein
MGNLCFTEKPLQFFDFTHKSLGSSFSLPPLFLFPWRLLPFSPHRRPIFLRSPSSSPPRFSPSFSSMRQTAAGRGAPAPAAAGGAAPGCGSGAGQAGSRAERCGLEGGAQARTGEPKNGARAVAAARGRSGSGGLATAAQAGARRRGWRVGAGATQRRSER